MEEKTQTNLAALLAAVSIEIKDGVTVDEARDSLRELDVNGRAVVARWLEQRLEGAGDQASTLWLERIGPWLDAAWPKEPTLRGEEASECLARAAAHAGNAFPDAVAVVIGLVGPIRTGHMLLRDLHGTGIDVAEPDAALELVNAIIPDNPEAWFGEVPGFLNRIGGANASLVERQEFKRLRDIAIRAGL